MAQRNIVTEPKHDNRLLDLVDAYCTACAEIARLSDRYADVEKYRPDDAEEFEAAKTEFGEASHNGEQLADYVAACPACTIEGAQAKARAALAYWGDQRADNAIARALCDDLLRFWAPKQRSRSLAPRLRVAGGTDPDFATSEE